MLEQAVILSVNLADNIMLGRYTQQALSGVAAVNQIQFVYQQLVYGIGNAVIMLGSQYWGQKRTGEIRKIASVGIRFEILLAVVLFAAVSFFPQPCVRVFTPNKDYISEGMKYLNIMRFSYLFFALTAVMLSSLRVVESVKIALTVSVISLVVNITINFLLIDGVVEMGVEGAAIGTLVARVVEFVIVLCYTARDQKLRLRFTDLVHIDRVMLRDFSAACAKVLGAAALWGVANALQTIILGNMNDDAISAQSISNTVFLLLKVTSVGAASAASVIIGKTVGEGDMPRLKSYTRTLQAIFCGIGVLLMGIMLGIRQPILSLYAEKSTTGALKLAGQYMLIQAVVLLTMSYQMPTNGGIIRGGGDATYILILDLISVTVFVGLAALGAFVWTWDVVVIIMILNVDQVLKCIPAAIYSNSYKWVKKLTRES